MILVDGEVEEELRRVKMWFNLCYWDDFFCFTANKYHFCTFYQISNV